MSRRLRDSAVDPLNMSECDFIERSLRSLDNACADEGDGDAPKRLDDRVQLLLHECTPPSPALQASSPSSPDWAPSSRVHARKSRRVIDLTSLWRDLPLLREESKSEELRRRIRDLLTVHDNHPRELVEEAVVQER